MIREYNESDINSINVLGRDLSSNYLFNNDNKCIVYEEEENIVGFITYNILVDRAEIIDFLVHINHRNKSIGSKLLEEVLKVCKESGCNSISLEVKSNNVAAVNLYKKYDFKIVSTRKKYYEFNTLDAHLMYREL